MCQIPLLIILCASSLQVDNIGLSQLAQQEAVSRIKDNPEVILTVLRSTTRPFLHNHVYEDVKSAEQSTREMMEREDERIPHDVFMLRHQQVRDRTSSAGGARELLRRKQSDPVSDRLHLIPSAGRGGGGGGGEAYKSPTQTTVCSDPTRTHLQSFRFHSEKVSADSGLSSSNSSFSPSPRSLSKPHPRPPPLQEIIGDSAYHQKERRESKGEASPLSRNIRVEGGYEVEVRHGDTPKILEYTTCTNNNDTIN